MDVIYKLKYYQSPGYDHILNEDITAAVMEETDNDISYPAEKMILVQFSEADCIVFVYFDIYPNSIECHWLALHYSLMVQQG